uniref:Mutator-like transposase domain-containing protein n=1 Tax=Homalodisca liturata TaxID=320908 RepID=A0A1B6JFM5_9HEMI
MGNKKRVGTKKLCYKKKTVVRSKKTVVTSGNEEDRPRTPKVVSTSNEKLSPNLACYDNSTDTLQYDIVNIVQLESVLKDVAVCRVCHGNLSFSRKPLAGLAVQISVSCSCGMTKAFDNCPKATDIRPRPIEAPSKSSQCYYDLNLRLVYGLRVIGKGYTAAQTLCGMMNLPAPPSKFNQHEQFLSSHVESVCENSMKRAVTEAVIENGNSNDLCVAVDGSWQKRGHTSLNGVVTITSADTGKVIDIYSMSKYCNCPQRTSNQHLEICKANYVGSSGGMEAEGATAMFKRSETKYGVRYVEYLGDGDSNGYAAVVAEAPYGPDVSIQKLECVGHVQKRMGTRIRDFIMKNKGLKLSDGKSLSGKGRLTGKAIQQIQIYYGLAIRRNTHSVEAMRRAVWALYCHVQSTNDTPLHILCPDTEDTWCKYNKAAKEKTKYDHSQHFHLSPVLMKAIKPIFKSLCSLELLRKCLKGKSQNPNESMNNVIWARLPKRTFVTLGALRLGVYEAVLSFNDGYSSKVKVLEHIGLEPGLNMRLALKRLDTQRIRKADKAATDIEKKIRQSRTLAKRKLEDLYQEAEDPNNPSYSAGHH